MKLDIKQVTQLFFKRKQYNYDKLNEIMERTLGIKNFTEGNRRLTIEQMEIFIGLLDVLTNEGEANGEGNNEKDKTNSGNPQVRETDGDENNRLSGERERPEDESGLVGLRSVQEVRSSPDVSDIPTDGGADSERGLYDN